MTSLVEQINELVEHIELHLGDDIDIADLAKRMQLSPWHFQRTFKSLVGDTLGGYVRGRRLSHAANQLLETDIGILEIALDSGFNSHEAFSRSFKTYFGLSPKVFRVQKPKVLLQEKPVLTQELVTHLRQGIALNPALVSRPATLLVGFQTQIPSPFMFQESYCDLLEAPWMQLLDRRHEIPNKVEDTYLGLTISDSGLFTEEEVTYLSAMKVTSFENIPDGMVTYELPEQMVAIFEVEEVSEDSVNKTMDYIYGYWLPNSEYQRAEGQDYELFEGLKNFTLPDMTSKYVIPVKPRQK